MRYARLILLIAPERLREIESHLQPGENRQEFIRRAVEERIERITNQAPEGAQREEGKMKTSYQVQVVENGIIKTNCGHNHRTIKAACACYNRCNRRFPDGSQLAKWFKSEVRHTDGSPLDDAETDQTWEHLL